MVKMKRLVIFLSELDLQETNDRAKDYGLDRSSMIRVDVIRANREYKKKKDDS